MLADYEIEKINVSKSGGWIDGPVEIPGRVLARVLSRLFRSRTSDKIFRKRETSRPRREGPIGTANGRRFPF